MSEEAEAKKDRKPRESNPWLICKAYEDNDTVPGSSCSEELPERYDSLQACESECRKMALANHGVTFTPIKYGRSFKAEEVKSVRVSRG